MSIPGHKNDIIKVSINIMKGSTSLNCWTLAAFLDLALPLCSPNTRPYRCHSQSIYVPDLVFFFLR